MRTLLIHLTLLSALVAGEIRIITPAEDFAAATVESITTGEALENPEPSLSQEGRVETFTFKKVKEGKYRVSYLACDNPMAYDEVLMETLVTVGKNTSSTVFLFRPRQHEQLKLPKDVEDFLSQHHDNFLELTVVYDGSKTPFVQARGGAWSIRYLRSGREYHLRVWNHSFREFPKDPKDRTVIFDQKFRTVERDLDPFAPGGVPEAPTK